jgi:hypothetical protein
MRDSSVAGSASRSSRLTPGTSFVNGGVREEFPWALAYSSHLLARYTAIIRSGCAE